MKMKRLCPECGEITEWEEINRPEEYEVKGEKITVNTRMFICPECKSEYEDLNSNVDPYDMVYEEYRRRKGMIHPAQILEFRKKYGLTQKELSDLLGFGDITLSRYENGALQDEAHDQLLHFILDPANLLKLIKQKPDLLAGEKKEKILLQLEPEVTVSSVLKELLRNDIPGMFTGNKAFDLIKLINLIKYFTFHNPVYKSKLLKLLFYADFKTFKENGFSITGLKYAHLPYGPVPDKYDLILASIIEITSSISVDLQPPDDPIGEVFTSAEPNEPSLFTESENEIIKQIHNYFRDFNSKKIEDFSHNEIGYKETQQGKLISYGYAKDLQI